MSSSSSRPQFRKLIRLPNQSGEQKIQIRGGKPILNLPKGLKITSIKTFKPPNTEVPATPPKVDVKIRAQVYHHSLSKPPTLDVGTILHLKQPPLHSGFKVVKEVTQKSKQCAYTAYACDRPVATNNDFCLKHVSADAKQCSHINQSGKRCLEMTSRNLCLEHGYSTFITKMHNNEMPAKREDTDTMLLSLAHYVRPERTRTESCASAISVVSDPEESPTAPAPQIDPFKQINASSINSGISQSLLECNSDSESDVDIMTVGDNLVGEEEDSSGQEETSYETRPLGSAGIYTAVEVVSEARLCLRMLQAAYMKRLRRLRSQLASARATYLRALKKERENHCSIHTQVAITPMTIRERKQLKKLKAYLNYRKKLGVEAVLARKLYHKRAKINDPQKIVTNRGTTYGRCVFTEGGVRCTEHAVPAAKHCFKHILCDGSQVLFSACGDTRAGIDCCTPVAKVPWGSKCLYHTDLAPYTVYSVKKDSSDSDATETEDEINRANHNAFPSDQDAIDMDFVDSMAMQLEQAHPRSQTDSDSLHNTEGSDVQEYGSVPELNSEVGRNSVPSDLLEPKSLPSDLLDTNSVLSDIMEPKSELSDLLDPKSEQSDLLDPKSEQNDLLDPKSEQSEILDPKSEQSDLQDTKIEQSDFELDPKSETGDPKSDPMESKGNPMELNSDAQSDTKSFEFDLNSSVDEDGPQNED